MTHKDSDVAPGKREDVSLHLMGKDCILHDTRNGRVHVLNPTAKFVWDRCDGSTMVVEILDDLRNAFGNMEGNDLLDDVHQCLHQFRAEGLIVE